MRVVFFGTPEAAVVPFEALLAAGFDIPLVVTQPDRRRGRGRATTPSPVKRAALAHGIDVVTPERAREVVDRIRATGAERGVVVAFGQLLPPALLDTFADGLVNLHYSLLPRWRGAAPVERAILAGDVETGVCVMDVEPTLDTGAVYAREVVAIGADETAGELHDRLTRAGAVLLAETLRGIDALVPEPQTGESTYADKLTVDEFRLDVTLPVADRLRIVRAGNPRPGAWLDVDGARLKVWRAHEEDGRFVPDEVQPEGKQAMAHAAWKAGHRGTDPFAREAGVVNPPTSRTVAIRALVRIEDGAFANVALPGALRETQLPGRDRAQVTEWVYGTVRWQRTLDHFLAPFLSRTVARLDPPVRAALRLGAYQLWSGVSAHAAVGETVAAVQAVSPRAKGFVNAGLRALSAAGPPWPQPDGDDPQSVGIRTSMPDWIVELLVADLGATDAHAVLDSVNEPGAVTLRVNATRATVDEVEAELRAVGASVTRGELVPDALLVTGAGDTAALPAVRDGRATPQDQASQAVAAIVDARAGERVAEIGAAPGGKATALGEAMGDRGLVVGLDRHPGRTRMIATAADRLGLQSVVVVVADGAEAPFADGSFDRVLLDAPCTGLGVLRRRPEARWRLRPEQVVELAGLQRRLLLGAAAAVRPGGRLVFSVCTLSAAETVGIDDWAAVHLAGFVAAPPPGPPWRPLGRGARLLPGLVGTDGMYCLVLQAPG